MEYLLGDDVATVRMWTVFAESEAKRAEGRSEMDSIVLGAYLWVIWLNH